MTRLAKSELLAELTRFADELGRVPTSHEMDRDGPVSANAFKSRFGSWNTAVRAAGFTPSRENYTLSDIARSLRRRANELGHPPRHVDLGGECVSADTLLRRFGSLDAALEAAGLDPAEKPGCQGGGRAAVLSAMDPEDLGLSPIGEREGVSPRESRRRR